MDVLFWVFFYDVFINIIEGSVKMCISSICLYWLMLYILYILCVFILDYRDVFIFGMIICLYYMYCYYWLFVFLFF